MKKDIITGIGIIIVIGFLALTYIEFGKKNTLKPVSISGISIKYITGFASSSQYSPDFVMFNGYKVPVSANLDYGYKSIPVSLYKLDIDKNLLIWKQAFQEVNTISDEYFNEHIFVKDAEVSIDDQGGKKTFYVDYYWKLEWASAGMRDSFKYSLNGVDHNITIEELLGSVAKGPFSNSYIESNKYFFDTFISKIKPVTRIASKNQIEDVIKKIVSVDAQYQILFGRGDDKPIIDVNATINDVENRCFKAQISLEDAEVIFSNEIVCRMY
ncbi:MAG: hypothetical protein WCP15_01485 [bacterium]